MATITVKNIPNDLYKRLKHHASQHHRSINSEVIFCLERALTSQRVDPESFLPRIQALQKKVSLPPLTDRILRRAKKEGRP